MSITQHVVKIEREKLDEKVRKAIKRPEFMEAIDKIKQLISNGFSLDEARMQFSPMSTHKWNVYLHALGSCTYTPGKIFAEYYVRSKTRMQLSIDAYNTAKAIKDVRTQMTAIMTMVKLDESLLVWAQSLGVIRPEEKDVDGGQGIDDADLRNEYAKLEQEIADRVRDEARAGLTIPLALLTEPEPKRESDKLEAPTLDVQPIK